MKNIVAVLCLWTALTSSALAEGTPPRADGDLSDVTCPFDAGPGPSASSQTVLSYIGGTDGTLTELKVVQSSGSKAQDFAVLDCVREWHFDPATEVGKLNIGRHRLNMGWMSANGISVLHQIPLPHFCMYDYPPELVRAHIGGSGIVGFTITTEGRVRDASMVKSTGNGKLDEVSVACVRDWRYRPARKDGHPVTEEKKVEVNWMAPPD